MYYNLYIKIFLTLLASTIFYYEPLTTYIFSFNLIKNYFNTFYDLLYKAKIYHWIRIEKKIVSCKGFCPASASADQRRPATRICSQLSKEHVKRISQSLTQLLSAKHIVLFS